MSLDYIEWCQKNGLEYLENDYHAEWDEYCQQYQMHNKALPISERLSGKITMTWQQEREAELWRRGKRILWPRHPLRFVKL
jgi:hypothetical protein